MPQYGVLVYSPAPADPMSLTPEHIEALERYPAQVTELGGRIVTGFGFESSATAKAVRGATVTDGTVTDHKLVAAGFFVLEAPDLDVALAIAERNPAAIEGGVEVRPLFVPPAE